MATMLSHPSWITEHKKWNKPTLGNVVLPGIVHFDWEGIQLVVEDNKASGSDGGGALIRGLKMPDFMFELTLTSKDDEDNWNQLAPYLLPRKDPRSRGVLPVYHPILARYQIVACIVNKLVDKAPLQGGPLKVRINCLAVAPAKAGATKKVTPKGIGAGGPGIAPPYIDPVTGQTVSDSTTNVRKKVATPPSKNPPLR